MSRRETKIYTALPKTPTETVQFQMPSGASVNYAIFQEIGTSTLLVQCDLCNRYLPLTKHKSTIHYQRHRGSVICRDVQDQNNAARLDIATPIQSQPGTTFINSFQEPRFSRSNSPLTNSASPSATPTQTSFSFDYPSHNVPALRADDLPPSSPPPLSPTSDRGSEDEFTFLFAYISGKRMRWTLNPEHSPFMIMAMTAFYIWIWTLNPEHSLSNLLSNILIFYTFLANLFAIFPDFMAASLLKRKGSRGDESPEKLEDSFPDNVCTGQIIEWKAGSVWDTYAFQQHDGNDIGWAPIGYEGPGWIRLQSNSCNIFLTTKIEMNRRACAKCFSLLNSKALRKFMDRAEKDIMPHTPWKYLNARQLKNMLTMSRKRANALHIKLSLCAQQVGRLQKKLNDYQRMIMLISQNRIAGVSRILSVALRNGANEEAICMKLHCAIEGTYRPHSGWTEREFDTAFLTKAIGGPRLLYALQKAEGYPSLSTLRKRKPIPELSVSVGKPIISEFSANISAFLGERGRKPSAASQVQIVIDGAAIEEAIRFDFKRKSLLGLCREHCGNIKTTVDDIQDLHNVAHALDANESDHQLCHYGKDATVLGIAPVTGIENYHVTPLVLASSCKTEKGEQLALWVANFIETYHKHPDGEARHGPIFTIATDGESSFRKLRFIIGLGKETVKQESDLGKKIFGLPGLNLETGHNGLLGTCDPKHIVKRFATMIRSPKGVQVGNVHITSGDVLRALEQLPDMTPEEALNLLSPVDKQNVPKAVNLLQCLTLLDGQKTITNNPTLQERMRCIAFISKVLGSFLYPFINVELSLSEQIRALSRYAHLITALYLRHGLEFMSSALIADSQAIVKNIIFTTARLQISDPNIPYFILFEGTDRLENVFSHVRTQDHARNFDIQQLSQKLSIGAEIDAIFQRHPDLDRGHIRRNLVNARGIDHMNPKSWIGDVRVGNVDLKSEYLAGRLEANEILNEHFHSKSAAPNFDKLFSKPHTDHLRPKTEYIGNRDVDDDNVEIDDGIATGHLDIGVSEAGDSIVEDAASTIDADEFTGIEFQQSDLLNPTTEMAGTSYLLVEGQKQYIPTLVSQILGADRKKKSLSTTHGLRVQGITVEQSLRRSLNINSSGDDLDVSEEKVKAGDLGGILVRVGEYICLAVVEVLNFRKGTSKTNLASIDVNDLDSEGQHAVTVAIQIIELIAEEPKDESEKLTWWWSQEYIPLVANEGGTVRQRHLVKHIPGKVFHPLSPKIIYNSAGHPIWSLDHFDLERTLAHAWSALDPESANIAETVTLLPMISGPKGLNKLPYRRMELETLATLFITPDKITTPLNLVKLNGTDQRPCHICNKILHINEMRNHVGIHILKACRDVVDLVVKEIGADACGWCGRDGCKTQLVESKNTVKITSNCEYHYEKMQYKAAGRPTNLKPCTNIPLNCTICPPASNGQLVTFWKYEFITHMVDKHLLQDDELPSLPLQLWATTHISRWEELKMGIPVDSTDEWRDVNQVLDSDDVNVILEEDVKDDDIYVEEEVAMCYREYYKSIALFSHIRPWIQLLWDFDGTRRRESFSRDLLLAAPCPIPFVTIDPFPMCMTSAHNVGLVCSAFCIVPLSIGLRSVHDVPKGIGQKYKEKTNTIHALPQIPLHLYIACLSTPVPSMTESFESCGVVDIQPIFHNHNLRHVHRSHPTRWKHRALCPVEWSAAQTRNNANIPFRVSSTAEGNRYVGGDATKKLGYPVCDNQPAGRHGSKMSMSKVKVNEDRPTRQLTDVTAVNDDDNREVNNKRAVEFDDEKRRKCFNLIFGLRRIAITQRAKFEPIPPTLPLDWPDATYRFPENIPLLLCLPNCCYHVFLLQHTPCHSNSIFRVPGIALTLSTLLDICATPLFQYWPDATYCVPANTLIWLCLPNASFPSRSTLAIIFEFQSPAIAMSSRDCLHITHSDGYLLNFKVWPSLCGHCFLYVASQARPFANFHDHAHAAQYSMCRAISITLAIHVCEIYGKHGNISFS
ncbi:uncharacterized protein LACBIDRAFT_330513 [Laccaria bicolor S238N-H82]|uniref:Predicted protein n=1 Tax=Laccaria bicolor (strain S238N-H82 / ATCC MYA-4686) TaxID=486041 RepID=B0DLJ6_LACBS|nr:uncharacterized protein LACBIDRAFT_330513 [Laccaria bicolor S238N-H82]EDR04579.1 predicted protein [Laccaria bicolor S238N-H82]|eukprot:XP_001884751.1 predicted protein [Laccaria bicolor S238N-H82]